MAILSPLPYPEEVANVIRRVVVTDGGGVERVLTSKEDWEAVLATLTPEERKLLADRYRFAHIENNTGIQDYTGTQADVGRAT